MNQDEQLNDILKRINELAVEIEKSRQELMRLQREVRNISGKEFTAITSAPSFPSNQKRGNSPFSLENFVGLKLIHFIGIIALVIGLAIGVKYAIDKNLVSPALRIGLAYLAAGILFAISYRLNKSYRLFSLILFGGSMATAYFTTYGAFAYYQFLPIFVAFGLMLLLAAITVYYSIKYNSQELAVLALVGGYGIPFLVRGNAENWVGLFSYIFIINLAVSYLSFKRYWTTLVYLSFVVTWMIFLSTVYLRLERIEFIFGMVFSILYFVLFNINTVSFKVIRKQQLALADTTLILINILLLYFAFLKLLRFDTFEEVSEMTIIFALFCLAAAYIQKIISQPVLQRGLTAMGLLLTIIYVPMRFDHITITIIWMLMAAVVFILGLWKKYKLLRLISILLFTATIVKLVAIDSLKFNPLEKIVSYILLGTILLAVSFLYQKFKGMLFEDDRE
jgi:uncharacterized membrane protein